MCCFDEGNNIWGKKSILSSLLQSSEIQKGDTGVGQGHSVRPVDGEVGQGGDRVASQPELDRGKYLLKTFIYMRYLDVSLLLFGKYLNIRVLGHMVSLLPYSKRKVIFLEIL